MARVGEAFPLECPNCGGDIRLISFITEPTSHIIGQPPVRVFDNESLNLSEELSL